ncbi:MAG: aminotransferase class V-fold PLP-dependent enzyme [Acidobacteria bacterium]|jgi:selenocysteine lyase/cysteine desulfurase|nr:aminotransferase class V-fold PLP-dependent enzyme [Acidobacteriota bacterium]
MSQALPRRSFLSSIVYPAAVIPVAFSAPGLARALAAAAEAGPPAAGSDPLTADEAFWRAIQQAFAVDRSLVNLNNGGISPSPRPVIDALFRHWSYENELPPYTMWQVLEPQREGVRQQLARLAGVSPEEIALTRNASEALETVQLGLPLAPGDELLTTTQDYPRMITTWKQRARREGQVLRQFPLPMPAGDAARIVALFEQNLTPKTKAILVSHVIFLTGQVMPVREIVALGRRRGIPVIVDGAHSFAHLDFTLADLDCDYFGTSLHKWLTAPHGTGMLFVRRERIPGVWPLMAADEKQDADIRKFEEIGTHPAAPYLAIAEAVAFHQAIGQPRKLQRLVHLRDLWVAPLREHAKVRFHTALGPGQAGGIALFQVEGLDSAELVKRLWERHRIFTTGIRHEEFEGIRVTPNVYTTPVEIARFVDAVLAEAGPARREV